MADSKREDPTKDLPTDSKEIEVPKGSVAAKLKSLREEILKVWENEVRNKIPSATGLSHPIIINTVPSFIDNLVQALSEDHQRELATSGNNIAQEHGGERARLSRYGPDQLILEYQILRDLIFEKLEAQGPLTLRERNIIQKSFDQGIQQSMMAFFLVHSRLRELFVASLSHDLRNPIGAAKMAGELILLFASQLSDPVVREDLKSLAQRVINNSKRADRMIQDLLDATVVQIGERLPVKITECDILSIVRDAVVELPPQEQKRIQINGVSVRGYWDYNVLRRAIENLISNAIKYGAHDTPVTIRIVSLHGRMSLSVHNEGVPIPVEDQEQLFQPFRRSRSAKASGKPGWGIGLSLVRGVAEALGGSVGVDSSYEAGTTLTIDIPIDSRPFHESETTEV